MALLDGVRLDRLDRLCLLLCSKVPPSLFPPRPALLYPVCPALRAEHVGLEHARTGWCCGVMVCASVHLPGWLRRLAWSLSYFAVFPSHGDFLVIGLLSAVKPRRSGLFVRGLKARVHVDEATVPFPTICVSILSAATCRLRCCRW